MGDISRDFTLRHEENDTNEVICKDCNRETSHAIITSYDENGSEYDEGYHLISWCQNNQIIKCLGCKTVSFRKISTYCGVDRKPAFPPEIKQYPAHTQGLESIETHMLPPEVQDIYEETIFVIENEQNILAGIGIRAIVETICKKRDAKGYKLEDKINNLKEQEIVTPEIADILHKLRDLGNDAAHQVKAHDSKQLILAMKIIKNILEGTSILPNQVLDAFPDKK